MHCIDFLRRERKKKDRRFFLFTRMFVSIDEGRLHFYSMFVSMFDEISSTFEYDYYGSSTMTKMVFSSVLMKQVE